MTVFYKNYLSLCAKANKTPSAVATAVGLSNAAASGWKKGKEPSDTTLQKLADYFDVTVEALTEEPKNKPALPQENELDNELIELLTHNWGNLNSKRKNLIEFIITTDAKVVDMMSTIADTIGKGNSENV